MKQASQDNQMGFITNANNNKRVKQMASRLNWKVQEDRFLKQLRMIENLKSWNEIAIKLNLLFPQSKKTAKQCRQRYTNASQFCDEAPSSKIWTTQQDRLLPQLFLEHGSKWTFFTKYYPGKSQNSIKNRFYGNIRKTVRKLKEVQTLYKFSSHSIKYDMIIRIFELAHKVQKEGQSLIGRKPDVDLRLFRLKKEILNISFNQERFNNESIKILVKELHEMNILFRSLGIYKIKNKDKWQLNQKRLELICTDGQSYEREEKANKNQQFISIQEQQKIFSPSTLINYPNLEFEEVCRADLSFEQPQKYSQIIPLERECQQILNQNQFFSHCFEF